MGPLWNRSREQSQADALVINRYFQLNQLLLYRAFLDACTGENVTATYSSY